MQEFYRQGDVLIVKIAKLPAEGLKETKDKVIIWGETTGHSHKVSQHSQPTLEV